MNETLALFFWHVSTKTPRWEISAILNLKVKAECLDEFTKGFMIPFMEFDRKIPVIAVWKNENFIEPYLFIVDENVSSSSNRDLVETDDTFRNMINFWMCSWDINPI
ncbi:hypothetical protein RF11_01767 [Thelohanellus kitauei]|uniref:Uncharacterized protein n=1 Tax=Thelohanellus kitauei TaxID=669202 RepID=A0A0C2MKI8_THEKT|nr:hypothetical protein RF11_01767 [Thelohanellus kitauei]